jgi:hypothetical protein
MASERKPTDVRITTQAGVIRVVYRGKVEYDLTTKMLRDVVRLSAESNTCLVLIDIREADYRLYHLEAIRHAKEAPSLGIDSTFRIAFLGAENEEMLGYVENVAVNRGYRSRAFTDESKALAWVTK